MGNTNGKLRRLQCEILVSSLNGRHAFTLPVTSQNQRVACLLWKINRRFRLSYDTTATPFLPGGFTYLSGTDTNISAVKLDLKICFSTEETHAPMKFTCVHANLSSSRVIVEACTFPCKCQCTLVLCALTAAGQRSTLDMYE